MTAEERELLLAYLVNEGLRIDQDLEYFRDALRFGCSSADAAAYCRALARSEAFKKFSRDLAALLRI